MNSMRTPFRLEPSQSYKKIQYRCILVYLLIYFLKFSFLTKGAMKKNKIANKFSLSFEAFQFLNKFEVIKTKQLGVFCCCNIKVLRIRECGEYQNKLSSSIQNVHLQGKQRKGHALIFYIYTIVCFICDNSCKRYFILIKAISLYAIHGC